MKQQSQVNSGGIHSKVVYAVRREEKKSIIWYHSINSKIQFKSQKMNFEFFLERQKEKGKRGELRLS
jgi:hypothetical protein